MRKFTRYLSVLLAVTLLFTLTGITSTGFATEDEPLFEHAPNTWFESVWAEWNAEPELSFTAQISADNGASWSNVDAPLVRYLPEREIWRVDVPGLAADASQKYSLRVMSGQEVVLLLNDLAPLPFARYGHAFITEPVTLWSGRTMHFPYGTTGGNNPDGSVDPDTEIWYITNDNLYLLDYLKNRTEPLIVRFIGTVGDPENGILPPGRSFQNKVSIENCQNVTLEGVGYDAFLWGIAFHIHNSGNIAIRNFEFKHATHDAIWNMGPTTHVWINHNTFHFSGDGSTDNSSSATNFTVAYNQYIGTRQTGLCNGDGVMPDHQGTFHNNWYYYISSRTPMARVATLYIFNQFYDHNGEAGITHRHGSSAIAEGNVIRGAFNYSSRTIPEGNPRALFGGQADSFGIAWEGTQGDNPVLTVESLKALENDSRAMGRTFSGSPEKSADEDLQEFIDNLVPNDLGTNAITGAPITNNGLAGGSRLTISSGGTNRSIGAIAGLGGALWTAAENLVFQPFRPGRDFPAVVLPADQVIENVKAFSGPMRAINETVPIPERFDPVNHVEKPIKIAAMVASNGSVGFRMGVMPWCNTSNSFMEWDQGLGKDDPENWVRVTGSMDEAPHNFTTAPGLVERNKEYYFRMNHHVGDVTMTSEPMLIYWEDPDPSDDKTILHENDLNSEGFDPGGWHTMFEEDFNAKTVGPVRDDPARDDDDFDYFGVGLVSFSFVNSTSAIPFDPTRLVAGRSYDGSVNTPLGTRLSTAWLPDQRRNDVVITDGVNAAGFATYNIPSLGYGDPLTGGNNVNTNTAGHLATSPNVTGVGNEGLWEGRGNALMLRDWTNGVANEKEANMDRFGTAIDMNIGENTDKVWISFDFMLNRDRHYSGRNNTYSSSHVFHFYDKDRRMIARFQTNSPTQNDPETGLGLDSIAEFNNKWMNFDILFDFETRTYDVYLNGRIFQYGKPIPYGVNDVSYFAVTAPTVNTGSQQEQDREPGQISNIGTTPNANNILLDNLLVRQADLEVFVPAVVVPTTIVNGYAANVKVNVDTSALADAAVIVELFDKVEPVVNGFATFKFTADEIPEAGGYGPAVYVNGILADTDAALTVVPKDDSIWSVNVIPDAEDTTFSFNADIASKAGTDFIITVNGEIKTFIKDGNKLIIPGVVESYDKIKIQNVKYPILFPSYSFTFNFTYNP